MRKFLLFLLSFFCLQLFAIAQIQKETFTYDSINNLKADLYYISKQKNEIKTLVIFVHGGGFRRGVRDFEDDVTYCRKLTTKGYALLSIDYRLFFKDPIYTDTNLKAKEYHNALEYAITDVYKSIIYMKKVNFLPQLDFNSIFVSGGSAGASTALASILDRFSSIKNSMSGDFNIIASISAAGSTIYLDELSKINKPVMLIHGTCDDKAFIRTRKHVNKVNGFTRTWSGSIPIYDSRISHHKPTKFIVECGIGHETAWKSFSKYVDDLDLFIKEVLRNQVSNEKKIIKTENTNCEKSINCD